MSFMTIKQYIGTHSWVFAVIEYKHRHTIIIHAKYKKLKAQRTGNTAIMTAETMHYKETAKLKSTNGVRQGNNCISLREICTTDGDHIDKRYTLNSPCEATKNEFE